MAFWKEQTRRDNKKLPKCPDHDALQVPVVQHYMQDCTLTKQITEREMLWTGLWKPSRSQHGLLRRLPCTDAGSARRCSSHLLFTSALLRASNTLTPHVYFYFDHPCPLMCTGRHITSDTNTAARLPGCVWSWENSLTSQYSASSF